MQVNPHTMTNPKLSLQQCLYDCHSLFAPYAATSRLWIDHRVTQQFSDIEKPSSSK
jgi:hypothetical protein